MINYCNYMSIAQSSDLLGHEMKQFYSICAFEGITEDPSRNTSFCCCLQTKVGKGKEQTTANLFWKKKTKTNYLHCPQAIKLAYQNYSSNSFTGSKAQGLV